MSPTHDYVIANGTGSSVRSDINDALAAVVSQNSSSTAPATTYAYMIWVDTTTNIVKMRNGANSAWIELFETDGEFGSKTFNGNITLNAQGDLRFADSDSSNWVAFQAPATVASNVTWTLPNADGTANQTLVTNGSGTLSWATPTSTSDKITEGNTEAEVVDTGSDGHFKVTTEGTERFRINSSGNVGIGTTSPSVPLHVEAASGEAFRASASGANQSIWSSYKGGSPNVADLRVGVDSAAGGTYGVGSGAVVWNAGNSPLAFGTNNTERARIDSSGRLLVGTSTSTSGSGGAAIQQIAGTNGGGDIHLGIFEFNNNTDGAEINLGSSRGTSVGSFTVVQNGDTLGRIRFVGADGTNMSSRGAQIAAEVDAAPGSSSMPGRLVFSTTQNGTNNPTARAWILNAGRFNSYAASSSDTAFFMNECSASGTAELINARHSATGLGGSNGTQAMVVYANGNIKNVNNSYGSLSDIKLKENIVDAGSQWSDLKALQVRKYNFKKETNQQTHTQIGLIAQEVELVSPGLVYETPDRDDDGNDLGTVTKSLNYSVLYMKAVKALQEAMERIEQLEAKVAALESA